MPCASDTRQECDKQGNPHALATTSTTAQIRRLHAYLATRQLLNPADVRRHGRAFKTPNNCLQSIHTPMPDVHKQCMKCTCTTSGNMAGAVCTGHDALISTAVNDKSCAPTTPGAHGGMPVGRATQGQGQCALATMYQPSLQAQTCVDVPVTHVHHPPSRWLQFVTTCRCLQSTQHTPHPSKDT